jgi:Zn-finger nucleic acid-binding protein
VDVCPQCAGVWFDAGELRQIMQSDPVALIDLEEQNVPIAPMQHPADAALRCPQCDRVLDRFHYTYSSPIELHRCDGCDGIWVEDGELKKMERWLHQARYGDTGGRLEAEKAMAIAQMGVEHERTMSRLAGITAMCKLISYRPGWGFPR